MAALPSEWIVAGLVLAALILIAVDLHLVGQGILAAMGVVALVVAGLLLATPGGAAGWQLRSELVLAVVLLALGFAVAAGRGALTVRALGQARPALPAAGRRAVALTDLTPRGIVRLDREEWSAVADPGLPPLLTAASGQAGGRGGGQAATNRLDTQGTITLPLHVGAGESVEVVGQDGLQLRVRRIGARAFLPKEA